jgi:hypothetical protein
MTTILECAKVLAIEATVIVGLFVFAWITHPEVGVWRKVWEYEKKLRRTR